MHRFAELPPRQDACFGAARRRIQSGDILEMRAVNQTGELIAIGTDGCYSHTAIVVRCEGRLCVAEALQWHSPQITSLERYVAAYPHVIDVWRPRCDKQLRMRAAGLAVDQIDCHRQYHWLGLRRAALVRLPLWRLARALVGRPAHLDTDELPPAEAPKFCTELVEWCYRSAGFTVLPGRHITETSPNDIWYTATAERLFRGLWI